MDCAVSEAAWIAAFLFMEVVMRGFVIRGRMAASGGRYGGANTSRTFRFAGSPSVSRTSGS